MQAERQKLQELYEQDVQERIKNLNIQGHQPPLVEMIDENANRMNFDEPSSQLSNSRMRQRNQANMIKNRSACSSVDQ